MGSPGCRNCIARNCRLKYCFNFSLLYSRPGCLNVTREPLAALQELARAGP